MPLVIDASTTVAWLLKDEQSEFADRAISLALREGASVPAHFAVELANAVVVALRASRVTVQDIPSLVASVEALRYAIYQFSLADLLGPVRALALEHRLSEYDAAYVHLAIRERAPLATLDRRLRAAAEAAGCELFV